MRSQCSARRWFRIISVSILSMPLLTGCLFSQQEPKTTQLQQTSFILGRVTLEDATIANQGTLASIKALFVKQSDKKTDPVSAWMDRLSSMENPQAQRAPSCERAIVMKNANPQAAQTLISVGNVYFGPVMQDNLMPLGQNQANVYSRALSGGLPAGAYQLVAQGVDSIPKFGEVFSLPEEVQWARVNGVDFGDLSMEYHRKQDLQLMWRAPVVENSLNKMLLILTAENDKEIFEYACEMDESDLMSVQGMRNFTMPASALMDVPKNSKLSIRITRGHVVPAKTKAHSMVFFGLRSLYSKLDLVEDN